ncbi:hypothetical protein [Rhodococcus sp. USK13]|uniref:hypothetical protein n=1 Tax=Rhodococcus sp. USK13 TaxID=2806442 RepID=UPI001BD11CDD|nr:hypothetical protein [Rhodococcus sp. USK13]
MTDSLSPDEARELLAADAGAQQIVTQLDCPALTELGFSSGDGDQLTLDVMTMP